MKIYVHIKTCTQIFTVPSFTIAKKWTHPKSPLTDEKNIVYIQPHNGTECSSAMKGRKYWYTCYNINEPGKHHAKQKNPETKKKGHILYDSIYMKCPQGTIHTKNTSGCLGLEKGGSGSVKC